LGLEITAISRCTHARLVRPEPAGALDQNNFARSCDDSSRENFITPFLTARKFLSRLGSLFQPLLEI
jgi:hypothetical protein